MNNQHRWERAIRNPFKHKVHKGDEPVMHELTIVNAAGDTYSTLVPARAGMQNLAREECRVTAQTSRGHGFDENDEFHYETHRVGYLDFLASTILQEVRRSRDWNTNIRKTLHFPHEGFTDLAVAFWEYFLFTIDGEKTQIPQAYFCGSPSKTDNEAACHLWIDGNKSTLRFDYRGLIVECIQRNSSITLKQSRDKDRTHLDQANELFVKAVLWCLHGPALELLPGIQTTECDGREYHMIHTPFGVEFQVSNPSFKHHARVAYDYYGEQKPQGQLVVSSDDASSCVSIRFDNDNRIVEVECPPELADRVVFTDDKEVSPWLKERDGF